MLQGQLYSAVEKRDFTAPSGRVHKWTKPGAPKQSDIDAIVRFEEELVKREKAAGAKPGSLFDERGNPRQKQSLLPTPDQLREAGKYQGGVGSTYVLPGTPKNKVSKGKPFDVPEYRRDDGPLTNILNIGYGFTEGLAEGVNEVAGIVPDPAARLLEMFGLKGAADFKRNLPGNVVKGTIDTPMDVAAMWGAGTQEQEQEAEKATAVGAAFGAAGKLVGPVVKQLSKKFAKGGKAAGEAVETATKPHTKSKGKGYAKQEPPPEPKTSTTKAGAGTENPGPSSLGGDWYHGTSRSGFTEFEPNGSGQLGPGVYFTRNPEIASTFAQRRPGPDARPGVYRVELDVKNPATTAQFDEARFQAAGEMGIEGLGRGDEVYEINERASQILAQKGFDSIYSDVQKQIVVFDTKAIRSRLGKQAEAPTTSAKTPVKAAPGEKVPQAESLTGGKPKVKSKSTLNPRQESIAKVREETGRKPYEREVIGQKEHIESGRKLHQEGHSTSIATQFKEGKINTLSGEQTVALDLRGNQLLDDIASAKDPETVATLDAELDDILDALNKSGTRQSADFRARQLEYRRASDELVMMQRAQKNKPGGKLTDAERAEVTRLSGEVKRLQGELTKVQASAELDRLAKAERLAKSKVKRTTRIQESREKHDQAIAYLKEHPITTDVVGAVPIPKISGKHFEAVKDVVKYYMDSGVYQIEELVDNVRKAASGITDQDIYLAIRHAAGEHGQVLNKGRTFGEDIQVSGPHGIQSPEIMAARRSLDKAKADADSYIDRFKPKTIGSRVDEAVTANVLLNPVARIFDFAANSVKAAGYGVQNLARVPIGKALSKATGKEYGGEQLLFTGGKLKRILKGAPGRWKDATIRAFQGTDIDSAAKYGRGNVVSRVTGITDVPFKDFYYRQAVDDAAGNIAKARGGGSAMRDKILAQLEDPSVGGPLSADEVADIAAHAQDWALRQTFNIDNVFSGLVEGAKKGIRAIGKQGGRLGEEAADVAVAGVVNPLSRFSRVIGNVALERANYSVQVEGVPLGLIEGGIRTAFALGSKASTKPEELRLIADLFTKGLVGIGLHEWGRALYRNGTYKPEIVKTETGTVYIDHGDAGQLGGWLTPILSGASAEAIENSGLSDSQKQRLRWENNIGLLADQPLSTGVEKAARSLVRGEGIEKAAGQIAASMVIPGGIRDWARRQDAYKHRGTLFKERRVKADTFGDQFKKNLPFIRDTMPSAPAKKKSKRYR